MSIIKKIFRKISDTYCIAKESTKTANYQPIEKEKESGEDFLLSAAVSATSDSPLLGFMAGGSLTGALLGSMFDDSDSKGTTDSFNSGDSSFDGFGGGESGGSGAGSDW